GAALTVVAHGDMVVDLWGGWRDEARTQRWQRETVVNIWSTTKGVAAMCFAMLVDQGRANYEEPVATWWPEFAQAGKGA
ncbi:serine hydrolase domain-containing protein, partial [Klebsiella pneumoniae]|uniref:serine hydrolase domain-containing protein n=1 Tax=Klebsiella pneumoniae TaxID=573 RepID=UPI003F214FF8